MQLTSVVSAAGLAIPFLCAIVAHVADPRERPVRGEVSRPGLSFRQYLVDLGAVPPGAEVRGWFEFINTGSTPVKITKIVPSCGCLQPRLKKEVYQPGERGDITVRVKTALEAPGAKEYRVRVDFDDLQSRTVELGFKLVLPENQVVVRPRALLFYQISGQPTEKEITVIDSRSTPLMIEGATSSSDLAAIDMAGAGRDEEGRWCSTIKVIVAGEVAPGEHHATVTLFSNDAAYPELRVPLIIVGRPAATAGEMKSRK